MDHIPWPVDVLHAPPPTVSYICREHFMHVQDRVGFWYYPFHCGIHPEHLYYGEPSNTVSINYPEVVGQGAARNPSHVWPTVRSCRRPLGSCYSSSARSDTQHSDYDEGHCEVRESLDFCLRPMDPARLVDRARGLGASAAAAICSMQSPCSIWDTRPHCEGLPNATIGRFQHHGPNLGSIKIR